MAVFQRPQLAIVLNFNDGPTFDGYGLSSIDMDLHTAGPGTVTAPGFDYYGTWITELRLNSGVTWGPGSNWQTLGRMIGVMSPALRGPLELVGGMIFHCDGFGPVTVDLTSFGPWQYSTYLSTAGAPMPASTGWISGGEANLGDLVIWQTPEPVTMSLLALGGLALIRRRRA
jgi:hypothetical protein